MLGRTTGPSSPPATSAGTCLPAASPTAVAAPRDPECQAFIESWFGQFKKRCAWRTEWETIDHARNDVAAYIDTYHHRPHSGLGYRTPTEVARAWADLGLLQTAAT